MNKIIKISLFLGITFMAMPVSAQQIVTIKTDNSQERFLFTDRFELDLTGDWPVIRSNGQNIIYNSDTNIILFLTPGNDEDAIMEMKAKPMQILSEGGTITLKGVAEGTPIALYSTDGREYGSTIAGKGSTTIATSLQPGSVAIVKIGGKAIKVLLK